MSYWGESRLFEKRIFSPTQSLKRLTSSSSGRTALPPSHPHAATSDAVPAPAANRSNARRSIMAWEPPPIPAGDHGAQRRRIHDEDEQHVDDEKSREDPHRPEVPVARRLESAEQRSEPRELRGLVDRKSGDDRQHTRENDERVRELLQRVVFSLRRMLLAEPQIILLHLDRTADVAGPEQERAPFAARHEVREIQQPSQRERPHQREMPIQCAGKPAAEPAPPRKSVVLKRIGAVVGSAALTEARIGPVDLQPARDHPDQEQERQPMREANDPVMSLDRRDGRRRSGHGLSILSAMRAATLIALTLLASCRPQNAAVTTGSSDTLSFADMTSRDSADTALNTPRVISEPTVVVFWLAGADTLSADDQAEALDELNYTTEGIAPTLSRHNIKLVPTNSDTIYVTLPNRQRRMILLSGVDYPFGYVLVQPGTAERILAGLYDDDELLDEVEAYFDLPSSADSTAKGPRISTWRRFSWLPRRCSRRTS